MRAVFEARFSISVFFFEKQHAVFFGKDLLAVLATEIGESSIFRLFVLGCEDRTGIYNHCRYFPVAKHNSGSSRGNFYGNVGVCVLKEKLDCLKEILQGTHNIVWRQLRGDGQTINEFHSNRHCRRRG